MLRFLFIACLSAARLASAECPWVAPKAPPAFEVHEGRANFKWTLDRDWYACAKAAGGTLSVEFLVGNEAAGMSSFQTKTPRHSSLQDGIYRNGFCEIKPLPDRVQVKVVGTRAFAAASWTSPVTKGIHCIRCDRKSWEESMAVFVKGAGTQPGMVTIDGSFGEQFGACARTDSQLELRVFLGRSKDEARTRPDPTFVIREMATKPRFKEVISRADICADQPEYIGVELFGDGEFAQLNGSRSVVEAKCSP